MRWRAASTSARSGTGEALMPRVYHGSPATMSQQAGPDRAGVSTRWTIEYPGNTTPATAI